MFENLTAEIWKIVDNINNGPLTTFLCSDKKFVPYLLPTYLLPSQGYNVTRVQVLFYKLKEGKGKRGKVRTHINKYNTLVKNW